MDTSSFISATFRKLATSWTQWTSLRSRANISSVLRTLPAKRVQTWTVDRSTRNSPEDGLFPVIDRAEGLTRYSVAPTERWHTKSLTSTSLTLSSLATGSPVILAIRLMALCRVITIQKHGETVRGMEEAREVGPKTTCWTVLLWKGHPKSFWDVLMSGYWVVRVVVVMGLRCRQKRQLRSLKRQLRSLTHQRLSRKRQPRKVYHRHRREECGGKQPLCRSVERSPPGEHGGRRKIMGRLSQGLTRPSGEHCGGK